MNKYCYIGCIILLNLVSCIEPNGKFQRESVNGVTSYGYIQDGNRIGKWVEINDSTQVRKEMFYGPPFDKRKYPQIEIYYYENNSFLTIHYKYSLIQDLSNYDVNLTFQHFPFLNSYLGYQLFHTNCGSCHQYFPDYQSNHFGNLVLEKYRENKLEDFLYEKKVMDTSLCLVHPSFSRIDSLELRSIIKYLTLDSVDIILPYPNSP